LRIATAERKKERDGNWVDHTEWHRVVCFGRTAENVSKYLKKGRQVYVEGCLRTSKYQDKEGKDKYSTEIMANEIHFLGSGGGRDAGPSGYGGGGGGGGGAGGGGSNGPDRESYRDEGGGSPGGDDDIPF
jgi:single-strand DNA-binding protein